LISLRPQEVASGRLLEGEDLKKQGERLEQVILKLQQVIPEEGQFVLSRIRGVLEDYHNQTDEKQNLLCTDSSDPKVTLEVGENPVGSCQSYATGSENKCLLGYTDPNSKVLVLRNERGKIVARSIFRLLSTPQGDPSLHVERIYSSIASSGVDRALYTHAMKKAKQMNVPLYISSQAQDENGISSEVLLPDGMQTEPVDYSLLSHTSRAPFVYVDSAGGRRSWGKYEVKNIVKVNESASIADI